MDTLKSKGQMLDQINLENIPRSGFDLSFNNKGTGKIGRIIPTRCMETLPGDSIKGSSQAALQFEPLAVPILSNMNVRQETWYVPNHILLDNWDTLISKGEDLSDNSSVPSFTLKQAWTAIINSIYDFYSFNAIKFIVTPRLHILHDGSYSNVNILGLYIDLTSLRSALNDSRKRIIAGHGGTWYSFVTQFDAVDLYLYRVKLIDNFLEYIDSITPVEPYGRVGTTSSDPIINPDFYSAVSMFQTDFSSGTLVSSDSLIWRSPLFNDLYLDKSVKDGFNFNYESKYLTLSDSDKKIVRYLLKSVSGKACPVFSDFGNKFVRFLYDFISPVLGVGSLLDYLGYNTISYTDFTYIAYRFFYDNINFGDYNSDGTISNVMDPAVLEYSLSQISSNIANFLSGESQSILPLRAYYAIWYNNYRDKLLETNCPEPSSLDTITDSELFNLLTLRVRCWSKDLFNTSLANTGTGNMVVPISSALSKNRTSLIIDSTSPDILHANFLDLNLQSYSLVDGTSIELPTRYLSPNHEARINSNSIQYEFSLDTLRRAGRTEKWIQKALIYGNLIQDSLYTHWGVKIKNERIQLPEFVSSSSQIVQINTLVNNTTTAESVAGDKSAIASAYDNGGQFDFYSPENGFLISLITILPEQSYTYGSPRHLSKLRIFDFAFPEFAQIGMDAVYNSEIRNSSIGEFESYQKGIFGYQGRYYDYKCKQDEEHGELRTTQDMYTFAKDFNPYDESSRPKLNYMFVHCWPSLDMFVTDDPWADLFRYDIHHSVAASRALPVCGLSV